MLPHSRKVEFQRNESPCVSTETPSKVNSSGDARFSVAQPRATVVPLTFTLGEKRNVVSLRKRDEKRVENFSFSLHKAVRALRNAGKPRGNEPLSPFPVVFFLFSPNKVWMCVGSFRCCDGVFFTLVVSSIFMHRSCDVLLTLKEEGKTAIVLYNRA